MRRRAVACVALLLLALAGELGASTTETATHTPRSSDEASGEERCAPRRRPPARRRPSSRRRRPAPRARPAPRPVVSAAYVRMRQRWHRPPSALERRNWMLETPRPLVLRPVGSGASYRLAPDANGRFGEEALATAKLAFRDRRDGETTDVHPRLLELCYRAVLEFRAPYVHLVSGYRTTRSTSRHNQGRAMDIVLPGVPDERLAAFLRRQGFVGVGTYPNSGFTHLDVRARSYYWVDRSGPDQASMTTPVRAGEIARNDAAARRRREEIVPDLVPGAAESDEARPRTSEALRETDEPTTPDAGIPSEGDGTADAPAGP